MTALRTVSYGGGVQSTALLVLAAQKRIDFNVFLFANVGDDSEHPATLRFVREVAVPYAAAHGIELHELRRANTLYGKLTKEGSQSTSIPFRSRKDGPPMSRSCTAEFKIRVIGKWLREHGATAGRMCDAHRVDALSDERVGVRSLDVAEPVGDCSLGCVQPNIATVGIGISVDEIHRANTNNREPYERIVYPLLDLGIRRADCQRIISDAGLEVPPKSSCYFCPHHTFGAWADMRRREPDLFAKAADLEAHLNDRNVAAGKGAVFISNAGIPLRDAISQETPMFDLEGDGCESGWCMT
jgi:hypothetical protein